MSKSCRTPVVGAGGGFLDAIRGGGWGPIVTSTLLARGDHPRSTIGSVSLAGFFLTVAISVTFVLALDFSHYWQVVVGLIIGGACAAPLAGYLSRILAPTHLDDAGGDRDFHPQRLQHGAVGDGSSESGCG